MHLIHKLGNIWQNYVTSGRGSNEVGETLLNKIKFFNYFNTVGIVSTLIFACVHLISGNRTTGWFEIAASILAIGNMIYFRVFVNYRIASAVLLLFMIILLLFLILSGGYQGTGIYWIYTFPALAFFLKGKLYGFFYLLFLYLAAIISYYLHAYGLIPQFYYSFTEIRQMLASLTAVSLLVYYYEKIKVDNEEKIKKSENDIIIKNIFDRQFEEAGEIQRTYIPQNTHHSEFLQIAGYYKPAMEIGGDYFDIFPLETDRTGVIICDVSSKGIPAALIMVKIRTMIKMVSNLKYFKPSQLFTLINKTISKEIADHMFITSIYLIIDQKSGEIQFSNAGHLPLTLFSSADNEIYTINSLDLPIGISENQIYKDEYRKVLPGDIIVLYTDGISETDNQHGEQYGSQRFHREIKKNSHLTAKEISDNLIRDISVFNKGANPKDDIALVIIKIH